MFQWGIYRENYRNYYPISFSSKPFICIFTHAMGSINGVNTSDGIHLYNNSSFYLKTSNTDDDSYFGFVEAIGI